MQARIIVSIEELEYLHLTPATVKVKVKDETEAVWPLSKVSVINYTETGVTIDIGQYPLAPSSRLSGPTRAPTRHEGNYNPENFGLFHRLLPALADGEKHSYDDLMEKLAVAGDFPAKSIGHSSATLVKRGLVKRTSLLTANGDKLRALQLTDKGVKALEASGKLRVEAKEEEGMKH